MKYHAWQGATVTIAGQRYRYATKPGAFSHGVVDPAALMLAAHVPVARGEIVVLLNGGNGLFAAVAATTGGASRVLVSDRNLISHEATRRTLVANGVDDTDVWFGHGVHGFGTSLVADLVAIRIPHEKLAMVQLLADAWRVLRVGGRCAIAGATHEGAKSAARLLEALFGNAKVLASEGGFRLVAAVKHSDKHQPLTEFDTPFLSYEAFNAISATLRDEPVTIYSRPGVFSWEHLDEATAILANAMELSPGESVLDLGCGSGTLGVVASRLTGGGQVVMLDADAEAVRAAERSARAGGLSSARSLASDIAGAVLEQRFDVVLTNPPFHVGKATALNVPRQFMRDARQVLLPGGRLFLVANRTLPYESWLAELFGRVHTLHDGDRFKVLMATMPSAHEAV